jgi:hypothetical protein
MNLMTPINDFPESNPNAFAQLTFTYDLPHNPASFALGQYPFSNFDGNQYAATQWINFISYPLSQNATSTYGIASLGAYTQVNPTRELSFATGLQDANNLSGQRIQANTLGKGPWSEPRPEYRAGVCSAQPGFLLSSAYTKATAHHCTWNSPGPIGMRCVPAEGLAPTS